LQRVIPSVRLALLNDAAINDFQVLFHVGTILGCC
jgi:hypothetical protein